jgi:hypothetical protein
MKFVFFRTSKPKAFEYKPLYYDAEKEEREQRKKDLGLGDSSDHKSFYRGELQRKWRRGRTDTKKNSRIRTMIYFAILLFAVYYIFFTDFVQNLVNSIT